MPRTCTACTHEKRAEIDKALVKGTALRDIAGQFSLSKSAVERHHDSHLPAKVLKAQEKKDVREALDIVTQLKAINSASWGVLQQARQAGEPNLVLRAVDRVQKQIELQAKLLGDLDERPQVNILLNPEFITVQGVIVDALEDYPEARSAVIRALGEVDDG